MPKPPIYCVQEHDATNLHWDLRLQVNEVLFSWAIPKGMPEKIGVKRLALRMPDHALAWAKFEGTIPKEEYGGGTVKIWDTGYYLPTKLSTGKMVFEIYGKRLKGTWKLAAMAGTENKWLIEKILDGYKED
jgi:bifunctional non-homologous end joining protein LigD